MSERDFTPEDAQALEYLADLMESDPALYERIVQEGFAEAERQEHGEALLGMIDNATEPRRDADRALLDAMGQARLAQEGNQE